MKGERGWQPHAVSSCGKKVFPWSLQGAPEAFSMVVGGGEDLGDGCPRCSATTSTADRGKG